MTKKRLHEPTPGEPALAAVDDQGHQGDLSVLEEQNIAFDPTQQHLDLTKSEKRRTTALMMAIQAYDKIIIKDAEMFIAINREAAHNPAYTIKPATMHAIVEAAVQFDMFISGEFRPDPALAAAQAFAKQVEKEQVDEPNPPAAKL